MLLEDELLAAEFAVGCFVAYGGHVDLDGVDDDVLTLVGRKPQLQALFRFVLIFCINTVGKTGFIYAYVDDKCLSWPFSRYRRP